MSARVIAIGLAALVWAVPVVAQERGTMEFGAFGSAASFDHSLSLTNAFGGGGRAAMFLDPRWSLEFEKAEMKASRPSGLSDVNVGVLSSRLMFVPVRAGRLSLLVGAGGGISTETNFMHSYGVDGLVGAKLALTDNAALRVDGVWDWLANQDWKTYRSVRVGISVYRHPRHAMRLVTVAAPPRASDLTVVHADSVSATETARLRDRDAALRTLRDSLNGAPATSAATLATMEAQIHFAFDKSELTDSATALLDGKIGVFRANPAMTIVLLGYTDVTGTDKYNMALGERRAQAAKDYIVAHGIAANRVIIESRGERHQIANTAGEAGEAPNRRAIFRLLIAPDVIRKQ